MSTQELDPQLMAAIVGGAIGIAGSVIAIIAESFIRSTGRIITNLNYYRSWSGSNHHLELKIQLSLDIYNSSELPKSFRDISIEVKSHKSKKTIRLTPYTPEDASGKIKTLEIINLPPKEIKNIDLLCTAFPLPDFYGKISIYFVAKYPNGFRFKKQLISSVIEVPKLEEKVDLLRLSHK